MSPQMHTLIEGEADDWGDEAFRQFVAEEAGESAEIDNLELTSEAVAAMARLVRAETSSPDCEVAAHIQDVRPRNESAPLTSAPQDDSGLALCPPSIGQIANLEIVDAYLQDAKKGITLMEQSAIELESGGGASQVQLEQICRELHTLKGASSTAGLDDLARYLHEVEEAMQTPSSAPTEVLAGLTFSCVDNLRRQITALIATSESKCPNTESTPLQFGGSTEFEDSVSVKASQLDRLMDMLAELVMLRNQRESRVQQLREVSQELSRCGSRLREVETRLTTRNEGLSYSNPLIEVASDISELSQNLRATFEPVAAENAAISSFIREFRAALVDLRRVPIKGLFQRLQRAAIDAARVEGKRVRFELIGAEIALERSVQEKLFEPLLHLVRNAVSHGIERPEDRRDVGKDSVGTVTLEASGSPDMLELTIREDGQGLDYDALRCRGIEMGILDPHSPTSQEELSNLIYRAGFSTRQEANAVAGRGVGLDVVANVLQRMDSKISIESRSGHGTSVRLTVPQRSIIEHAMIIRSNKQLLAIPMSHVSAASKEAETTAQFAFRRSLSSLLGDADPVQETARIIVKPPVSRQNNNKELRHSHEGETVDRVELTFDQIVGPEEVVVRPLPPLLRAQQLFIGVTLSGTGQIVLVLDPAKLLAVTDAAGPKRSIGAASAKHGTILVVDDSLSSRRHVSLMLHQRGWETVEAADGISALDKLEPRRFDAVITDFEMPRMDGAQLTHAIRSQSKFADIPIFMSSSLPSESIRERVMQEGVNSYCQKPIEDPELDHLLQLIEVRRNQQ